MKKMILAAAMVAMGHGTICAGDKETKLNEQKTTRQIVALQNNWNNVQRRTLVSPKFVRAQKWFARPVNSNGR